MKTAPMGNCKTNPRKIPKTQADVDRAFKDGCDAAIKIMLTISTYTLKDKCGAEEELIHRFADGVTDVCDSINRGYVSFSDIERDLKETYDWEVDLRLSRPITVR